MVSYAESKQQRARRARARLTARVYDAYRQKCRNDITSEESKLQEVKDSIVETHRKITGEVLPVEDIQRLLSNASAEFLAEYRCKALEVRAAPSSPQSSSSSSASPTPSGESESQADNM